MRLYLTAAVLPDLWQRIFSYDFMCDGPKPDAMEDNFGMVGYDYSARPAYVATATTSRMIDGRVFIKRLQHPDSSIRIFLFGPANDPLLVAWCTEIKPEQMITGTTEDGSNALKLARFPGRPDYSLPVTLSVPSPRITIHDWQDREKTATSEQQLLQIDLTPWPVFIRNLGPANSIAIHEE